MVVFTLSLLIYADDVFLLGHSITNLQKLLHAIHAFCDAINLCVNVAKTKVMIIQTNKIKNQPILMYNGQSLKVVDCFKYLGINVPSNHMWGACAQSRMEAGMAKYYEFENMGKQSVTKRWEIKAMVFETCVVQTFIVWCGGMGTKYLSKYME